MGDPCFAAIAAAAGAASAMSGIESAQNSPSVASHGNVRATKSLSFGRVEMIDEATSPRCNGGFHGVTARDVTDAERSDVLPSPSAQKRPSLRRSPTPLVHSLAELAEEHRDQLCRVWNEPSTLVPDLNTDKEDIASSLLEIRMSM